MKSGKSLKERARDRIAQRRCPDSSTFDDYLRIRSSCWIVEERDGDFFCDCPIGMKVILVLFKLSFNCDYCRANFARLLLVSITGQASWRLLLMLGQSHWVRKGEKADQRRFQTVWSDHQPELRLLLLLVWIPFLWMLVSRGLQRKEDILVQMNLSQQPTKECIWILIVQLMLLRNSQICHPLSKSCIHNLILFSLVLAGLNHQRSSQGSQLLHHHL